MILVRTKRERMVTMSVRVEIRMPDDMHKQVKEDAGKNKVTITDIILDALSDKYLAEGKKSPTKDMPALPKSPVAVNSEVEKPAKTPEISKAPETSGVYFHPMPKAGNSKQHKATGKLSAKPVAPVVSAMLLTIKANPTVSHHPCCNCGVCKPLSDKLSRL